jgi:hypothetical protein
MKKLVGLTLLTISILGLSFGCKNRNPESKAKYIINKVEKKLELNQNQKEKLLKLKDKILTIQKNKIPKKEEFQKDVKKLIVQVSISEVDIKSLLDRKRNDLDQILPEVLPELIDFHASLNPDQKNKLVQFIDKFGNKWHHKKHD